MNETEQSLTYQINKLSATVSQLVASNNKLWPQFRAAVQTITALTQRVAILEAANQAHAATLTNATQQSQTAAATTPTPAPTAGS